MSQSLSSNLRKARIPILVGLMALTVYLLALAPDLTWAHNGSDGGDLIAASYRGGAAHPPGYPLYLLVSRAVAMTPIGSIPFRYNLFSALAAAGAAALVAWAVGEYGRLPSLAAGLSLAFAPLVWSQAVITEVYAMMALLAVLIVGLSLQSKPRPLVLGAALGLGLTHHLTLMALAPLVLEALRRWAKERGARTVFAHAVAGFLIGLLPLVYLPVTSSAPVGWGDASTLKGFWWLVSAELYRGYALALPVAWIEPRIASVARLLADSFTWPGVIIGLWGFVALWERDRLRAVGLLVAVLALAIFAVGYNTSDSQVYLVPAWVVFAVWIGAGWGNIWSTLFPGPSPRFAKGEGSTLLPSERGRAGAGVGLTILMLALPAFTLVRNWSAQDLRADRAARDFVNGVMAEAPERAIVVTSDERHTFALWVGAFVEKKRPGVAVVNQDLLGYDWYNARLQRGFPGLVAGNAQDIDELVRLNPGRPVCRPTKTPPPWLACGDK
jgi:hypothetical protein